MPKAAINMALTSASLHWGNLAIQEQHATGENRDAAHLLTAAPRNGQSTLALARRFTWARLQGNQLVSRATATCERGRMLLAAGAGATANHASASLRVAKPL
jgi:hypothetical protein